MQVLKSLLEKFGLPKLMLVAGLLLGTLVFFGFILMKTSAPHMGLLFSNLDPADGAKILDRLRVMNIPFEVKGDSDQIYVPSNQIAKLRMELAGDGLPAGGTIGYEIFDKQDLLGTTSNMVDINLMRATEGEISKSIKTIQGVQSARVHLVMPKKELFSNEKPSPSASVILKMKGASRLSVNQVLAIQHLVASAVPNLSLEHISIVDDKGTLLAKGSDSRSSGEVSTNQLEIREALESKLSRSIESLLERTVGPGRVRAEVSADIDFDKVTSTSVEYNPDGQVARTQQNTTEGSNSNEASISEAVTIQNTQPETNANSPTTQSKNQDTRSEENTSFEISNTTKTHIHETGGVKRLSIAVLVDGIYTKNADGKNTYRPRTDKELKDYTDLIKTAVGFQEKRGDTIKVLNLQFNDEPELPDNSTTFMKWVNLIFTPKVIDTLSLLGLALILFLGFIRPVILKVIHTASFAKSNILIESENEIDENKVEKTHTPKDQQEEFINIEHIDGRMKMSSIKKISELIEKHPEETVSIIRNWMYS